MIISKKRKIENEKSFNDEASDVFHRFLESLTEKDGFKRPVREDDLADEGWEFIYTEKGMRIIERMKYRLRKVGMAHFPNIDIQLDSYLYQEY